MKPWLLTGVLIICASYAGAGEGGHYPAAAEGIKAATLPPPGLYLKTYNIYYTADTLRDANRNKADVGFDVSVFAFAPRLIWITDKKFLGADYGMDILVPILDVGVDIDALGVSDDQGGIGDIFVEPLVLAWHNVFRFPDPPSWWVGDVPGVVANADLTATCELTRRPGKHLQ